MDVDLLHLPFFNHCLLIFLIKTIASLVLCSWLILLSLDYLYNNSTIISHIISWIRCQKQRKKLRRQGIKGPSPSLFSGNVPEMQRIIRSSKSSSPSMAAAAAADADATSSKPISTTIGHDYTSSLFPYFDQWRKEYGPIYTYSTGYRQHIFVSDPEIVKELSQCMTLELGKPSYVTKAVAPMLGNGILRSNGAQWAQQRKIIAPEFFSDKVKAMVGLMREAAEQMLTKWETSIETKSGSYTEIRIDDDLRAATGEVISRAFFGNSYGKGKDIFAKLRSIQKLISKQGFLFKVANFRFLLTKTQREIKLLEKEIECLIWDLVQERVQECSNSTTRSSKNLLQMILDGAINDHGLSQDSCKSFIVDNCKNIYFAGHESTAVAASWCLMLLALHPEWQDRVRTEVAEYFKDENDMIPDVDSLFKMKTITMVIQETLRLYTPAAFISREALEDFHIGGTDVPKGVCIWALIPALHRDPKIWGPDAHEFKPERFANGVANACKVPQAYVPFGLGARLCLGRNFAMLELKIFLCIIVSKLTFTLSPRYRHSPAYGMIIEPGDDVYLNVMKNDGKGWHDNRKELSGDGNIKFQT